MTNVLLVQILLFHTCQFNWVDFDVVGDILAAPIHFSTLVEESIILTHIYKVALLCCVFYELDWFRYVGYEKHDILVGITWFSPYYKKLNCNINIITYIDPGYRMGRVEGGGGL